MDYDKVYSVNLTDVKQIYAPYKFDRETYVQMVRQFIQAFCNTANVIVMPISQKKMQILEPILYEATTLPQDYTYISMDKPKKKREFPKQNFANNSIRQGKARQQIMRKQKCKRRC